MAESAPTAAPHWVTVTLEDDGSPCYEVRHPPVCETIEGGWCPVLVLRYAAKEADWPDVAGEYTAIVDPATWDARGCYRGIGPGIVFERFESATLLKFPIPSPNPAGVEGRNPAGLFYGSGESVPDIDVDATVFGMRPVSAAPDRRSFTDRYADPSVISPVVGTGSPWEILIGGLAFTLMFLGLGWLLGHSSGWPWGTLSWGLYVCAAVWTAGSIGAIVTRRKQQREDDEDA
jgi:hypothetical protein